MLIKLFRTTFTLNQDCWLSVFKNCIVYFFTFFNANIGYVFRTKLGRIKYIISEKLEEWNNKGHLCCFFRRDCIFQHRHSL